MRKVTVQFEVEVPHDATDAHIEDWIAFEVGASCRLKADNSMVTSDLRAIRDSVRVVN